MHEQAFGSVSFYSLVSYIADKHFFFCQELLKKWENFDTERAELLGAVTWNLVQCVSPIPTHIRPVFGNVSSGLQCARA